MGVWIMDFTTINQKVVIPATPEEVYETYVDPKKHAAFTGSKATGKALVRSKFTAWDGYIFGRYLELEKGKRVVQEWITTDWTKDYPASRLELTFQKAPKGTVIVLAQSNVPSEQVDDITEGWTEFYWEPMKKYFKKLKKQNKPKP